MRAFVPIATAACSLALLAAGCGSSRSAETEAATAPSSTTVAPTPGPNAREQEQERIVRTWSGALNADDNDAIAALFSLPADVVQGTLGYRFKTRREIALWFSGLPCSGKITRILYSGRFATAVFRLANRGTHRCDAPGGLAAARFEIVGGKIKTWTQVDVPPEPTPTGPIA